MSASEKAVERLEDLVFSIDEQLTKLEESFPTLRAELQAHLNKRVLDIAETIRTHTRDDLRTQAIAMRYELSKAFAGTETQFKRDLLRLSGEVSESASNAAKSYVIGQLEAARRELAAKVEDGLAKMLAARQEAIGLSELRPVLTDIAEAAANQVMRQYARVHAEDLPKVIRREMASIPIEVQTSPAPQTVTWADSFKGNWDKDTLYKRGDIFSLRGSTYLVLKDSMGVLPTQQTQRGKNARYGLLAAAGAPGPKGADGTGGGGAGTGDVVGPSSSVDNRPALFDGTTGKLLKQASAALGTAAFTASTAYDAAGTGAAEADAVQANLDSHTGNTSNPHSVTKAQVGLGSVTNDVQTKAAIVPNGVPSAGQLLVGNAGNTAYEAVSLSGDATLASTGAITIANDAVTYAKMQNVSATSRILGRKTAGAGDPEECSLSEILDFIGSAAQGDILYRGATGWARLAAGTSGHYLQTQGAGANPQWAAGGSGGGGYALSVDTGSTTSPADSSTYYFGGNGRPMSTTEGNTKCYILKPGTLQVAELFWFAATVAGSNENISVYVRLNGTTDTLVATVGDTNATKRFSNTGLSIAVVAGDYFEMKIVTPAWATNPTGVQIGGHVYVALS